MKPAKKTPPPESGGTDAVSPYKTVFVGTYKGDQLTRWSGWYAYPVSGTDTIVKEDCSQIGELWLFRGTKSPKVFRAEFAGIKTREELVRDFGRSAAGQLQGARFLLFRTEPGAAGAPDCSSVGKAFVRVEDFARNKPDIVPSLKAWLESEDRTDPSLGRWLPAPVVRLRPRQLRVRSGKVRQMQIWDIPSCRALNPAVPFPGPRKGRFTFIDLFAGIGGIRLGFQAHGGKCVYSSEFDGPAQKTYAANFGEVPYGDITLRKTKDAIPPGFDIVCAGFPCQAFSMAGKRMGFNDNYKGLCRGTLFKEVVEICERHKPKAVFCENVKGLLIHDRGRTLRVIKGSFEELGYRFFHAVLNSKDFGVPQNRERLYMVALRNDIVAKLANGDPDWAFPFPRPSGAVPRLRDIRESDVPARYYLSTTYLETLKRHRARHEALGHGFGYEIRDWDGIAGAIVCGGMGRERNLVVDKTDRKLVPETHIKGTINPDGIRRMTPREWARLQGFPEAFRFVLSDVHLYKQFGNSVSVPVISAIAGQLFRQLAKAKKK